MEVLFALMGVFMAAFVLALLPLLAASVVEGNWKHGTRKSLLGFGGDSFRDAQKSGEFTTDGRSGLALWPHGDTGPIGFGGAISRGYVGWQDYKGRATRGEFWWWYLYTALVGVIGGGLAWGLSQLLGVTPDASGDAATWKTLVVGLVGAVVMAVVLSTVLPTVAVMVRRLHDSNKRGWWLLLYLVPLGAIVVLVFLVMEGTQGDNKYGPNRLTAGPERERIPA